MRSEVKLGLVDFTGEKNAQLMLMIKNKLLASYILFDVLV